MIVLSTDSHTSRLIGWQIAERSLALALLVGTDPQVGQSSAVERVSAYVADLTPGEGCPICQGVLDPEHLRREALPQEALEGERRDGYIPTVARPAVLPWNLAAAAELLSRLLELLVGLPPAPERGVVRRLELLGVPDVRCRTTAVRAKQSGCTCGLQPKSEFRPRLGD